MNGKVLSLFAENNINYSVVEFDYKFCKYRNLDLHKLLENKECDCAEQPHGKYIRDFLNGSKNIFFMKMTTVASMNIGLHPILAVWVPNLLFAFVALYLFYKRIRK